MILRTKEGIWYDFTSFISPWSIADQKNIFVAKNLWCQGFFFSDNGIYVNVFFFYGVPGFFYHFNYDLWALNNRLDGHLLQMPVK